MRIRIACGVDDNGNFVYRDCENIGVLELARAVRKWWKENPDGKPSAHLQD